MDKKIDSNIKGLIIKEVNEVAEPNAGFELKITPKGKKVGFYTNLDENLHKKLKAFAILHGTTMSEVIEQLIDQVLVL